MESVGTIITPYSIQSSSWNRAGSVTQGDVTIYAYRNTSILPRVRMVYDTKKVRTFEEAFRLLNSDTFHPEYTAITETEVPNFLSPPTQPNIDIREGNNGTVTSTIHDNKTSGLFLISDTYYPGWRAFLDGKEVPILPVNIAQRAIVVPAGTHTITMTYTPQTVFWRGIISMISILLLSGGGFLSLVLTHRTRVEVLPHVTHRESNHGR